MSYTVAKGNQRVDADQVAELGKIPDGFVDLRSDTVTQPTPEMRRAMAEAEVGDDVYGEDPTVNRLEQRAAEIFGREAAIFVPTGTMGNQIAIKIHTHHGQEVICEERAHIINLESATIAAFAGCQPRPIYGEDGVITWEQIKKRIAPRVYYRAQTGLIVLEKMPARLKEDHDNARILAEGLAQISGIKIDPKKVPTNILVFDVSGAGMNAYDFNQKLAEKNVLANAISPDHMRLVTHKDVTHEQCLRTIAIIRAMCNC